ncbi:glycosyltransferase [Micromonospora sp. BRA006-A]|nr:glycosyltransferase [Micromonospora sp. BRA006-A]
MIRLPENVGFSRANNVALREATGRYVLFANPDLEVRPDDLDALARHLDTHGGLVAPQLLGTDGTAQANGRGFRTRRRSSATGRCGRCPAARRVPAGGRARRDAPRRLGDGRGGGRPYGRRHRAGWVE